MNEQFFTQYQPFTNVKTFSWSTTSGLEGVAKGQGRVKLNLLQDDGSCRDIEFLAYLAPKVRFNIISACRLRRDLGIYYNDRDFALHDVKKLMPDADGVSFM